MIVVKDSKGICKASTENIYVKNIIKYKIYLKCKSKNYGKLTSLPQPAFFRDTNSVFALLTLFDSFAGSRRSHSCCYCNNGEDILN